mgnify:CR=1 FL=1
MIIDFYNRISDRYLETKKQLEESYCNKSFVILLLVSYAILIGILLAITLGQ